ncbi:DedA family protein [Pandoraea terrae]
MSWLFNNEVLMQHLQADWLAGLALITLVIFVETGVVVMPFLPGDSIVFALGAFLGISHLSVGLPFVALAAAAIAGDALNFTVGRTVLGKVILRRQWISAKHLAQTDAFFQRYGGVAIFLGRFVPIVRTVVPFVAGMTDTTWRRFLLFNVSGGITWIAVFLLAGFWLGHIEWIRTHLMWLSLAIVVISVLPIAVHALRRGVSVKS